MISPRRGRLVAFEGIDGCGKSTQARLLCDRLGATGTFEPGASSLGRSLRAILLAPDQPEIDPRAEALLMAADRAQHVAEIIEPALSAGRWVVTDRYVGSTVAYQGYGRGLDVTELASVVRWGAAGLDADLVIFVDVPVEVASARRQAASDRFETLGDGFQQKVADGFAMLASESPERWVTVDGSLAPEEVGAIVARIVHDRLET